MAIFNSYVKLPEGSIEVYETIHEVTILTPSDPAVPLFFWVEPMGSHPTVEDRKLLPTFLLCHLRIFWGLQNYTQSHPSSIGRVPVPRAPHKVKVRPSGTCGM